MTLVLPEIVQITLYVYNIICIHGRGTRTFQRRLMAYIIIIITIIIARSHSRTLSLSPGAAFIVPAADDDDDDDQNRIGPPPHRRRRDAVLSDSSGLFANPDDVRFSDRDPIEYTDCNKISLRYYIVRRLEKKEKEIVCIVCNLLFNNAPQNINSDSVHLLVVRRRRSIYYYYLFYTMFSEITRPTASTVPS